jgi:hypothetical protein
LQPTPRTEPRRASDVNRECGTEGAIRRWLERFGLRTHGSGDFEAFGAIKSKYQPFCFQKRTSSERLGGIVAADFEQVFRLLCLKFSFLVFEMWRAG